MTIKTIALLSDTPGFKQGKALMIVKEEPAYTFEGNLYSFLDSLLYYFISWVCI
jgi:hypothetical protein